MLSDALWDFGSLSGTGCPRSQLHPSSRRLWATREAGFSLLGSQHNQEFGCGNKPVFLFASLGALVTSLGPFLWPGGGLSLGCSSLMPSARICCAACDALLQFSSPLKYPQLNFKTQHFSRFDPVSTKGSSRTA